MIPTMTDGTVIETIETGDFVWINVSDRTDTSAILVKRDAPARCVAAGDLISWKPGAAFWTPKDKYGRNLGPINVKLARVGNSGVARPKPAQAESVAILAEDGE